MKSLFLIFSLLFFFNSSFAKMNGSGDLAIIHRIDNFDLTRNYVEVSEEGLPSDHYINLVELMYVFQFTLIPEIKIRDLFEEFKKDSRARMRNPGGFCSTRRIYIQNLLQKMNIVSGKILVNCPANNGRLRFQDQVSKYFITFSNFHDTNIIAVKTNSGVDFRVIDLQFQNNPVSLHEFLTEIETSQKIRPLKRKGSSRSLCYWTISTQNLTY